MVFSSSAAGMTLGLIAGLFVLIAVSYLVMDVKIAMEKKTSGLCYELLIDRNMDGFLADEVM